MIRLRTKKIALTLCLLTLMGGSTVEAQSLVLHHANGTTTDVELLTQPQVTFKGDKVLITSQVLDMEYPKADVLRFTYKGKETAISQPQAKGRYSQENGRVVFHGVKPTDNIAVYNAAGIRIPVEIQRSGDAAIFSLSAIPSGVCLISINGRTSKYTKP